MDNPSPFSLIPQEIIPNLFQSGIIVSSSLLSRFHFGLVIDLEGGFDRPSLAKNITSYLYWPISDGLLPDIQILHQVSSFGAFFIKQEKNVLVHCFFGYNRSSLLTGVIMSKLGYSGDFIVKKIKDKIPLSLSNHAFLNYLLRL